MIHDEVCTHLLYSICKALGIEKTDSHTPRSGCEQKEFTVCWNQAVHTDRQTDRQSTANRPDIIIKTQKHNTCKLINLAISTDGYVVKKAAKRKKNTTVYG
jgi:hypothetical protein